jgi:pimeloyl-ACP methyl ester carboxylesterase
MHLEVVTHAPKTATHSTPLLFVHGAWHGAWCWEENFLPYFAQAGYHSHALDLRGHGKSGEADRLRWTSISHYVSDVRQVVERFEETPILIGHSMGGLVVQKYLESDTKIPAAVLLASVPPGGVIRTTLNIAMQHPIAFLKANATMKLYPIVGTPQLTREAFFSADMHETKVRTYYQRIQNESYRAFLDMMLFNLPRPRRVKTPMLVLGAANDTIFSVKEVKASAKAYRTEAEIFNDMAHDMMLEAGWQSVADRILEWLEECELSKTT